MGENRKKRERQQGKEVREVERGGVDGERTGEKRKQEWNKGGKEEREREEGGGLEIEKRVEGGDNGVGEMRGKRERMGERQIKKG